MNDFCYTGLFRIFQILYFKRSNEGFRTSRIDKHNVYSHNGRKNIRADVFKVINTSHSVNKALLAFIQAMGKKRRKSVKLENDKFAH